MKARQLVLLALLALCPTLARAQCVSLTTGGVPYGQDFDSLASAGDSSVTPAGWFFLETGANANGTYSAGNGSGNTGNTYSFGATGSTERAFGGLLSGNLTPTIGACFSNGTGAPIAALAIAYTGEQWRLGTAGRADRLDFQYSLDATSLATGSWVDVDALDFSSPSTTGSAGARDGNAAAYRTAISQTITGLAILPGASVWIRWNDFNATGADDGLAVDDFSLTPTLAGDAAPYVASTTPADGATGVAANANLTVTFSEAVNVTGGWFSISCASSGLHPAAVSGGPITFTLDPATDFTPGESCTVTIYAAAVSDQDADDPPDEMAANYVWSFTVASLAAISIEKATNGEDADLPPGPAIPVGAAVSWTYLVTNSGQTSLTNVTVTDDQGVAVTCPQDTLAAAETMTCTASGTAVAGQYANVGVATGTPPAGPPVAASDPSHYFGITFVINEIHADPSNTQGDANGDGVVSATDDEFVELVNATAGPIDISGWTLADAVTVRHTFPPGTVVPGGCAAVVFGGGTLAAYFGGSVAQTASTGQLGLNNTNETVTLSDGVAPVAVAIYGAEGGNDQSITRVPDVTGSLPWVLHTTAPGSGGLRYSPGRKVDRTLFGGCAPPPLSFIHDVQGAGAVSPFAGQAVQVEGVVTGVKANGFFLQEEESDYDADPATSEGIYVFTSVAPPPSVAVGNVVRVVGVVSEYVPTADPLQPPLTEIVSPGITLVATGQPLPAPVVLTPTMPDPAGAFDQLERYEGMRVAVPSLTVVAPTRGSISEPNATATSNGIFSGVVSGVSRPFREPGIQQPDHGLWPAPPSVPVWDTNPETLTVDSDALGGTRLDVGTGTVITGLVGPLDYGFRRYTLLPDPGLALGVSGGPTPAAVTAPGPGEITVATYNVQRFFDTVNDPGTSDPVLTPAAFDLRLAKLSDGVRNYLHFPDVLGLQEVENLTTLEAIAARISADALGAGQPDPLYAAHLSEGNDIGGIDVGFLVRTAEVVPGTPRVTGITVTQVGLADPDALWDDPGDGFDGVLVPFNDRPPLVLTATVHAANGAAFPLTVIVNHLRSFNGVGDPTPLTPPGVGTANDRASGKRLRQAQYLANLIQARQLADPAERIIVLGDMNAYEFNDGFVDSLGTIAGTPAPDDQTLVPGDGGDLVDPDLVNLLTTLPAAERYSYVYDGQAQTLDHVLVNAAVVADTGARRLEHARINADWPEVIRGAAPDAIRLSDHDPVVLYLAPRDFATADLSVLKTAGSDPVVAGADLAWTITVSNAGPDPATGVSWSDPLPAGTTFVSLSAPGGWSCTTPAPGAGGTVSCEIAAFGVGSATFTLVGRVAPDLATGTAIVNTATLAATTSTDPNPDNDSATATVTARSEADFQLTKTAAPEPVTAGGTLTYTLTVVNPGPSLLLAATLTDPLPAGVTLQTVSAPPGWTCTGAVTCTHPAVPVGTHPISIVVLVDPALPGGSVLVNAATLTASTLDPVPGDAEPAVSSTVLAPAAVTATKSVAGSFRPGGVVTYTIALTNSGPGSQPDLAGDELSDVLPAQLALLTATADAGVALADPPSRTVTWNGPLAAGATVTITITARIDALVPTGTPIVNQATFQYDADGDGTPEAAGVSDDPDLPGAADPTTFEVSQETVLEIPALTPPGLLLLALLLAAGTIVRLRRRPA
ncbi:MAG: DUF11 domain-containing protein [Acidobacteria bacterium]|nr:DUF11 domain-containing protein [Acidobacteriota bacterium]